MKETIFFATFSSRSDTQTYIADREIYFPERKTLQEFFEWVQLQRVTIEQELERSVVIDSVQFIKLGY